MLNVFLIMLFGVGVGILLRSTPKLKHTGKVIMVVIYALLFLLGKEAGEDDRIMSSLDTLGVQALLLTLGAVVGSALCAKLVYNLFFKKHEG
ncbi:LysO family transporter [Sphingobacterium wenxiniae]|nr:LysO family transporter [Sphingobacterium wenxiniae]